MKRIPLILWYGSIGATAIIRDELKAGNDVDVLSIEYSDVTPSTIERQRSMIEITDYYQRFDGAIRTHYHSNGNTLREKKLNFIDNNACVTWVYHVLEVYNPEIHSKVVCGITSENRFWAFEEDIMSVFDMMTSAKFGDKVIMEFPFKGTSADKVAREHYTGGHDLLRLLSVSGLKGVSPEKIHEYQTQKCA